MLDNVHYFGYNPGTPDSGRYCGQIGEQQLQFVRNVLAHVPPEQLVVLSMHIPLVNYQDPSSAADNTIDRRAPSGAALVPAAHGQLLRAHASDRASLPRRRRRLPRADAASPSRPHGRLRRLVGRAARTGAASLRPIARTATPTASTFSPSTAAHYTTRFVPAVGKAPAQLRAVVDGPHRRDALASTHGTAPGAIALRGSFAVRAGRERLRRGPSNERELRNCQRRARKPCRCAAPRSSDPYVARLFAEHASVQKPWVRAVPSSHVWKAPLPAGAASPARIASRSKQPTNTAAGSTRIWSWKSRTTADRACDGSRWLFSGRAHALSRVKPR